MNIIIDKIAYDDKGEKIAYLQFLDDNNEVIDTTSVAYTDDVKAFNSIIKEKFIRAIQKHLDLRDARSTIESHIDTLAIGDTVIDAKTKVVTFKDGSTSIGVSPKIGRAHV